MTPAPITTMVSGILPRLRAPVEVTITDSSASTPGRLAGSEPVAITMDLASWISSPTFTLPGSGIEPQPLSQVILFFLKRNSMPLVLPSTTSCL